MRSSILMLGLVLGCSAGDLTLPGGPAEPARLRIVGGDDQRARAGAVLEEPLAVQVLDAGAQPVAGATVEFGFVGQLPGAGLQPATVVTDGSGRAVAVVRLGSVTGEQTVVARVAGTASEDLIARFTATALGGGGGNGNGNGNGDGDDDDEDDDD